MSKEENKIDLECSSCSTENTVNLSSDIKCKKCNKSLTGKLYKNIIISAGLLVGLGAIGGALVDDVININRASVKTEYKMMRTCVNRFQNSENCYCAVESMSGIIDAEKARLYGKGWLKDILAERYKACLD